MTPITYLTIERIFTTIADSFGLSVRGLIRSDNSIKYNKYRCLCSYMLWKQALISQKEAADMLGITQSGIQYHISLYRSEIKNDLVFSIKCEDIFDMF